MENAQELTTLTEKPLSVAEVGEIMMNVPLLQQIDNMAVRMATATATVPKHLAGKEGDCWAVIMQSIQWGMNPYVVAQKTHVVSGTLGYEAQLVNAVVQASGMCGRFHYEYDGDGAGLKCRVGAVLRGEEEVTWGEWLCFSNVKVKNSPLWVSNPRQQMGYLQGKNWVRLYAPGAILGVYTSEELRDSSGAAPVAEKDMGPADLVTQEGEFCTDAFFEESLPAWQEQILEKSKEPEKLIKFLNNKGLNFTPEQTERIMSIGVVQP